MSNSAPSSGPKPGWFVAIVGPSGVGKDTVLNSLRPYHKALNLHFVQRHITRDDTSAEDSIYVPQDQFDPDNYALSWQAHGLSYGIPKSVTLALQDGIMVLANLSRQQIQAAESAFDQVAVVSITVDPAVQSARLAERGREAAEEIERRLARQIVFEVTTAHLIELDNSGPIEGVTQTLVSQLAALRIWDENRPRD